MNAETIEHWLAAVGVPAEVVSIGAEADNAWCLLRCEPAETAEDTTAATAAAAEAGSQNGTAPETNSSGEWEVFWREQGNRYDWARFTNEQVACFYLFGRLAWTQTAAGVLSPAAAPTG